MTFAQWLTQELGRARRRVDMARTDDEHRRALWEVATLERWQIQAPMPA